MFYKIQHLFPLKTLRRQELRVNSFTLIRSRGNKKGWAKVIEIKTKFKNTENNVITNIKEILIKTDQQEEKCKTTSED